MSNRSKGLREEQDIVSLYYILRQALASCSATFEVRKPRCLPWYISKHVALSHVFV